MNRHSVSSTWIGVFDKDGVGTPVFVSSEQQVSAEFFHGTPNHDTGDCVCLQAQGFVMEDCGNDMHFICEKQPTLQMPVEGATSSNNLVNM